MLHFRLLLKHWRGILYVDILFRLGGGPKFAQKFDQTQLLLKKIIFVEIWTGVRHSFV